MTEYTQAEMLAMAHSVPSRSPEDDLRETVDRIYHRNVTHLQMAKVATLRRVVHCPSLYMVTAEGIIPDKEEAWAEEMAIHVEYEDAMEVMDKYSGDGHTDGWGCQGEYTCRFA
jgi:hypothetical protein